MKQLQTPSFLMFISSRSLFYSYYTIPGLFDDRLRYVHTNQVHPLQTRCGFTYNPFQIVLVWFHLLSDRFSSRHAYLPASSPLLLSAS